MSGGLTSDDAQDDEDEAIRDARAYGFSEDDLDGLRRALSGDGAGGGVWPENVAVVEAFLAVATQWRTAPRPAGFGSGAYWVGLDYSAVRVGLEASGIVITPRLWGRLMIMEDAAVAALNRMGDGR